MCVVDGDDYTMRMEPRNKPGAHTTRGTRICSLPLPALCRGCLGGAHLVPDPQALLSPISLLGSFGHTLTDRHHGQARRRSSVGLATFVSPESLLATVGRPRQQTVAPSSVTAVSGLEYLQPGLPAAALFVLVPSLGCDVLAALWVSSSDPDLLSLFSGSLQSSSPFQCQSP